MKTDPPIVDNDTRSYLSKPATFGGSQAAALGEYAPLVLCHHAIEEHDFPVERLITAQDVLGRPLERKLNQALYRAGRMMLPAVPNRMARLLWEQKARLLHFHFLVDARFFIALKRLSSLPAVVSCYGYDVSSFPHQFHGLGKQYLAPVFDQMDCFIAMSQDMRADLLALGCPEKKIVVHYYGTDSRRFEFRERSYGNAGQVTLLVTGSLVEKKGQRYVLQALKQVESQGMAKNPFRVVLVGAGPEEEALRQQVSAYGWTDRVVFAGHIPYDDPRHRAMYRQADIFTLPSVVARNGDKEGIPGTIVEAMASGLPVVSTCHAGIPEIIQSGQHGILVEERDVPALAAAYAALIDHPSLRQHLGQAAASRALQDLDLQRRTPYLERIYSQVIQARQAAKTPARR